MQTDGYTRVRNNTGQRAPLHHLAHLNTITGSRGHYTWLVRTPTRSCEHQQPHANTWLTEPSSTKVWLGVVATSTMWPCWSTRGGPGQDHHVLRTGTYKASTNNINSNTQALA
ncbi:hypothetical protein Pmani_022762 [Petrolisthes manimaculis]|uniref:Uncharacterized protein n=1 Tax=Petrolisthes manimaculis TaxID=1843537 RepID=A0AAE1PBD5_9EUCA|nr:hypothetical protein Pmani_022762 [Petrolisthes manimaculis]